MKVETKMEVAALRVEVLMVTERGDISAGWDEDGNTYFAMDGVSLPPDVAKRLLRSATRQLMEGVMADE
jgi:hypothetical protein